MSRGPDAETLLRRALVRDAARHRCVVAVETLEATRWASATFSGVRLVLSVGAAAGVDLERWLADLPEADLPLRQHLVADIAVVAVARADETVFARIEALTVEA